MSWFQEPEPERRRPPRQLHSRTIGKIPWDSHFGDRTYDVENDTFQEEVLEQLPDEPKNSWYGLEARREWTDHIRKLLHDPKSHHILESLRGQRPIEHPPLIALDGTEIETGSGGFAVLSHQLMKEIDVHERQFQKWYASLMLGLGKHLADVNTRVDAVNQMGITKRDTKRKEYQAQNNCQEPTKGSEVHHWTAWISQIKLNEQEVPEFFRTSDAMKQTVEIVEDEEELQTTTCTPKDIDKDPEGWKKAFEAELDSFERLGVMDSVPLS